MFYKKLKKKIRGMAQEAVAIDDYISNYGKTTWDIDAETARLNYETYQNHLRKRQQNLIKKWNVQIIEASSTGKRFIMTNQFVTDNDKNKILFMLDDANCCVELPADATLQYFQEHYESKGFEVVKIEYQTNGLCCLKIIWIPFNKNNNDCKEV